MISQVAAVRVAAAAAVVTGAVLLALPSIVEDEPDPEPAVAEEPPFEPYVSGWLPYWKEDEALASFTANADLFTDVTTFFHYVSGSNATLEERTSPEARERAIREVQTRGLPVLAAVLDNSGPGTMRGILLDPARRAAHIQQLLPLVDQQGYDGIDIDYENFAFADGTSTWSQTRPAWVAFISELSAALRERGKLLTVAAPPMFNTSQNGSSGYWVYDWPAIAPHIDELRVMTYDYSTNAPGPVAPMPWVEDAVEFGLAALGPDKFSIGVPTYGRDWLNATSGAGCAVQNLSSSVARPSAAFQQIAADTGTEVLFDDTNQEAYYSYNQALPDCTAGRTAYFSDARSVAAKGKLALDNDTTIILWSLGGEDPATWDALREVAEEHARPDETASPEPSEE